MNKLNTTKKGDLFEKQVYDTIKKLVENDELYISGKRSKVFLRKAYKSKQSNNNIVVDISIETFLPNADKYSQLTIIECKNYESAVPINDIREFSSILNEISEHNTKGIIVSNTRFQDGVYNYAVSTGIGLGILNGNNTLDWVSYRVDKDYNQYNHDMIESFLSKQVDSKFFVYFDKKCFESLSDLLKNIGIIDLKSTNEYIKIPYKTEEQINVAVKSLGDVFLKKKAIDTDILCDFLHEKYQVDFCFDNTLEIYNHYQILGKIAFNPLKIYITNELKEDIYRWRFTLAHEVGHLILHSDILKNHLNENIDSDQSIFKPEISEHINKRMEIQANIFATKLLLPEIHFKKLVIDYFAKERIRKPSLLLDSQQCNISLVYNLLNEIKYTFGVSHEVGKIHLKKHGLLIDKTDNSIKGILSR